MDGNVALEYILKNDIPGALVECGVEKADFQAKWISHLQARKAERHLFLYDTFKGLTQPGEHDYTADTATLYKNSKEQVLAQWTRSQRQDHNSWCYCSLKDVQKRLASTGYPQHLITYVEGDVMKTLETGPFPEAIALLRLDTDWYESSKFELEKLYDRVSVGGVIVFDDYYHWNGQRKATDEFFKERGLVYDIQPVGNRKSASIIKH